ncbi:cytochrome d ubiquinol oxidase subunit II [Microbacterium album]|uniref:Cytochrome c oxidase assembly protein n=1 Tax=Microbacterium album TaxID=2053191 RepID=A0A917IIN0_9MICO|nr:cytochrome d ubiquinol oxidase subunit II [Microbacterium album]GGH49274.1 cytochrome c oxidase assembly protein [Microbacterium album]
MEPLPVVWFVAIAVLWLGYLLLEGFDLGVGMHMVFSARSENDRRVMLNTIGPVWDGNEVWLITAGAAMFAAFPHWYASLFSALYVPLVLVLLALILRAVGIEYRGKMTDPRWIRVWNTGIGIGSLVVAFGIGAALAITSTGLPLNAAGNRVGGPFAWLTVPAVLGGLGLVGFALVHGATFLGLKADGPVRERAGRFAARWAPMCLVPAVLWTLWVQLQFGGSAWSWTVAALAVAAAAFGWGAARARRERRAFLGFASCGAFLAASVFTGMFPRVLPSTIDAAHDLTVWTASSSPYTLGVMTVVACVGLPIIVAYQAWSYWVFRARVTPGSIPSAHDVIPAVLRARER